VHGCARALTGLASQAPREADDWSGFGGDRRGGRRLRRCRARAAAGAASSVCVAGFVVRAARCGVWCRGCAGWALTVQPPAGGERWLCWEAGVGRRL